MVRGLCQSKGRVDVGCERGIGGYFPGMLSWKCWHRVMLPSPPPNDMSSQHAPTCWGNVKNVGLTFLQKCHPNLPIDMFPKTLRRHFVVPTCSDMLTICRQRHFDDTSSKNVVPTCQMTCCQRHFKDNLKTCQPQTLC